MDKVVAQTNALIFNFLTLIMRQEIEELEKAIEEIFLQFLQF